MEEEKKKVIFNGKLQVALEIMWNVNFAEKRQSPERTKWGEENEKIMSNRRISSAKRSTLILTRRWCLVFRAPENSIKIEKEEFSDLGLCRVVEVRKVKLMNFHLTLVVH